MVMAQPLVQALAGADGATPVDVLAPDWVLGLVQRMPGVARTVASPFAHGQLALGARRALGRRLAHEGYVRAVVLPNSFKSALVPWFAGIGRRTGFRGEMRLGLLNDIRSLDRATVPRLVDRFLKLATGEGPTPDPSPRLLSDPDRQTGVRQRLGLVDGAPLACLCPGAEYGPAKRWPEAHFATVADALSQRGLQVCLLGSARDAPVAGAIAGLARRPVADLCGRTSLEDAVDLLAGARVAVSNDSGLMHVAAAVGCPVAAVFGSSSPDYTPPLSPRARVLRRGLPCSPCFQRECPLGHLDCLRGLAPERVLEAVQTLMEDDA